MTRFAAPLLAALACLGCLPRAASVGRTVDRAAREEVPPAVTLRIDGRRASGSGELQVAPDSARAEIPEGEQGRADLALVSDRGQRIEIEEIGRAADPATLAQWLAESPGGLLRYEQRIRPDGRQVFLALLPGSGRGPAVLAHLDFGGGEPVRRELLPGLVLEQRDLPDARPDVVGAAARRTWLPVEVHGSSGSWTLQGGETGTISHQATTYRLHVYRSLRRSPGTDPRLPFEGERYLLTATLTR